MSDCRNAEEHIRAKVRMVTADESLFGVLSTGASPSHSSLTATTT
jgi:hypothetical protein